MKSYVKIMKLALKDFTKEGEGRTLWKMAIGRAFVQKWRPSWDKAQRMNQNV